MIFWPKSPILPPLSSHRQGTSAYADWSEGEWHKFSLGQFLREADDVEYTLADAEEVFRK